MARLLQLVCVGLLILAYVSYVEAPQLFDRGLLVRPNPSGAVDATLAVGGDGGVVITPAQAGGVATVLWRLHDEGLVQRNANTIAAVEVDPARGYDLSLIAYALAKSESLSSEPLANATVMVPLQSSYPAYFLALLALSPSQGESGAVVAAVMICSVLLRKGMTFFQSRVFLLDGNGKAVFKFYGSFWSDADVEALARFLGVDLEGSRADWFTPAGLARAVPGSVNVLERHPRLFWVAAAIAWGIVVILIRLALLGLHGS